MSTVQRTLNLLWYPTVCAMLCCSTPDNLKLDSRLRGVWGCERREIERVNEGNNNCVGGWRILGNSSLFLLLSHEGNGGSQKSASTQFIVHYCISPQSLMFCHFRTQPTIQLLRDPAIRKIHPWKAAYWVPSCRLGLYEYMNKRNPGCPHKSPVLTPGFGATQHRLAYARMPLTWLAE